MSQFPVEIYRMIVESASFGAINALARSCRQLAAFVRANNNRLAAARVDQVHALDKVARLPNGGAFGKFRCRTFESDMQVMFELTADGRTTATDWRWDVGDISVSAYGHTGYTFAVEHDPDELPQGYRVIAYFADGEVCAHLHGRIRCRTFDPNGELYSIETGERTIIDAPPLHGYMIDNRVRFDVIKPWFEGVLEMLRDRIDDPHALRISRPYTIYADIAHGASVLDLVDGLRVERL